MAVQQDTTKALELKDSVDLEGKGASFSVVEKIDSIATNSSNDIGETGHTEGGGRVWKASLFRFGPLSGILCMFLAIACVISSLGVLAGSDGQEIEGWTTPPSTYLAIFTAIANLSMRYAAIQGVVIAWWARALRGSTVSRLHWDWRSGTTLYGALTAGRHMSLLGLACIFSTFVVIDGPLLQRSSTVVNGHLTGDSLPLNITMAPELPQAYTGVWTTAAEEGEKGLPWNIAFNDTVPAPGGSIKNNIYSMAWPHLDVHVSALWNKEEPLEGVVEGCDDQCTVTFFAPALFETSCIKQEHATTYFEYFDEATVMNGLMAPPINSQVFSIGINLVVEGEKEKVVVTTGASETFGHPKHTQDCNTTYTITSCIMEHGIGEYRAFVKKNRIRMESLGAPKLVAMSNNTKVERTLRPGSLYYPSTLGGIIWLMQNRWITSVSYWTPPKEKYPTQLTTISAFAEDYVRPGNQRCPTYLSAREDVIKSLNKLMVYFGSFAAHKIQNHWKHAHNDGRLDPGFGQVHSTVEGYPAGTASVFQTHYRFFIAAALVEIVCLALVAPTYWGWWNIGRPVSFSPLELSKAFDSSVLSPSDPNCSGRDLAEAFRDTPIKYGSQVTGQHGSTRIVFGHPHNIARPESGESFSQT